MSLHQVHTDPELEAGIVLYCERAREINDRFNTLIIEREVAKKAEHDRIMLLFFQNLKRHRG